LWDSGIKHFDVHSSRCAGSLRARCPERPWFMHPVKAEESARGKEAIHLWRPRRLARFDEGLEEDFVAAKRE